MSVFDPESCDEVGEYIYCYHFNWKGGDLFMLSFIMFCVTLMYFPQIWSFRLTYKHDYNITKNSKYMYSIEIHSGILSCVQIIIMTINIFIKSYMAIDRNLEYFKTLSYTFSGRNMLYSFILSPLFSILCLHHWFPGTLCLYIEELSLSNECRLWFPKLCICKERKYWFIAILNGLCFIVTFGDIILSLILLFTYSQTLLLLMFQIFMVILIACILFCGWTCIFMTVYSFMGLTMCCPCCCTCIWYKCFKRDDICHKGCDQLWDKVDTLIDDTKRYDKYGAWKRIPNFIRKFIELICYYFILVFIIGLMMAFSAFDGIQKQDSVLFVDERNDFIIVIVYAGAILSSLIGYIIIKIMRKYDEYKGRNFSKIEMGSTLWKDADSDEREELNGKKITDDEKENLI